jgi:hypothetical protein
MMLGRTGARIFYGLLGAAMAGLAIVKLTGLTRLIVDLH